MTKNQTIAIAWISTAVAVSIAVYLTKNPNTLFTFLIPSYISNFTKEN